MEIGTTQPNDPTPHYSMTSLMLYVAGWALYVISETSVNQIWVWTWRGLSAISLLLIIYINWNKALDIFRARKKKQP